MLQRLLLEIFSHAGVRNPSVLRMNGGWSILRLTVLPQGVGIMQYVYADYNRMRSCMPLLSFEIPAVFAAH